MAAVKTVLVVRGDHPDGCVMINESDMQPSDKLFKGNQNVSEEKESTEQEEKKVAKKRGRKAK